MTQLWGCQQEVAGRRLFSCSGGPSLQRQIESKNIKNCITRWNRHCVSSCHVQWESTLLLGEGTWSNCQYYSGVSRNASGNQLADVLKAKTCINLLLAYCQLVYFKRSSQIHQPRQSLPTCSHLCWVLWHRPFWGAHVKLPHPVFSQSAVIWCTCDVMTCRCARWWCH